MGIKMDCIRVGMLQTNCYLVYDEERKEALIADPGDNADFIMQCVEERGVKPVAILLTHAHGDHVMALPEIKKAYNIPVYVHKNDEAMLNDGRFNLSSYSIYLDDTDVRLEGGEELELGGMKINAFA